MMAHWNQNRRSYVASSQRANGWRSLIVTAIVPSVLFAAPGRAQQALPPPPAIPNTNSLPSLAPLTAPVGGAPSFPPPAASSYPRESIYQAPIPTASSSGYQVVVNGDSPYLLQQIQLTEPSATVQTYGGRRIIQAGSFASEAEAQQRVAALASQGVAAQVVGANGGYAGQAASLGQPGFSQLPKAPHYEVVVPTRPEQFATIASKMTSMGVKPEAIQAKRAPLGPHVAVGPFVQQGEAESVSQYLRSGGLDARVYYAK